MSTNALTLLIALWRSEAEMYEARALEGGRERGYNEGKAKALRECADALEEQLRRVR